MAYYNRNGQRVNAAMIKPFVAGGFAAYSLLRKPKYDTAPMSGYSNDIAGLKQLTVDGFDALRQDEKVTSVAVLVDSILDAMCSAGY